MDRYAIATSVVGDKASPQFHCNVIKLDGESVKPIGDEREAQISAEPTKQRRIRSDVDFEHIRELSFDAPIDQANMPATAKRFLGIVTEVARLQAAKDDSANTQVPILIGEDGRNGADYYPRQKLFQSFMQAVKADMDEDLLGKVQFHFGFFNKKGDKGPQATNVIRTKKAAKNEGGDKPAEGS